MFKGGGDDRPPPWSADPGRLAAPPPPPPGDFRPLPPPGDFWPLPHGPGAPANDAPLVAPSPTYDPRRRPNRGLFVAAGILLAAVLGAGIAAVALRGGGNSTDSVTGNGVVGSSSSNTAPMSDTASTTAPTTDSSRAPAPVTTPPAPTSTITRRAVPVTQVYTAPGGIAVRGPIGWVRDTSAGVATIRDYLDPATSNRFAGAFFRIGIGNTQPPDSFDAEALQAAQFLRDTYSADVPAIHAVADFLGTPAWNIDYSFVSPQSGLARRGVERLWRNNGVTMIIQASDVAENWSRTQSVFARLTASARVY